MYNIVHIIVQLLAHMVTVYLTFSVAGRWFSKLSISNAVMLTPLKRNKYTDNYNDNASE